MRRLKIRYLFVGLALSLVSCNLFFTDGIKEKSITLLDKVHSILDTSKEAIRIELEDDFDEDDLDIDELESNSISQGNLISLNSSNYNTHTGQTQKTNSQAKTKKAHKEKIETKNKSGFEKKREESLNLWNVSDITEKSNSLIKSSRYDDSYLKSKMQAILDSVMQKIVQAEKIMQIQKQSIKDEHHIKMPNSKNTLITNINTNNTDAIKKLMEALQLIENQEKTQTLSIKKIYTEASENYMKFTTETKSREIYYAPQTVTIAYSKSIQLINHIIDTIKNEDEYSGKYGYILFLINETKMTIDHLKYAIKNDDLIVKTNGEVKTYRLDNALWDLVSRYNESNY
ncbi:hypothetical protein [Borrelia miyamotoi]|uniref:Lipoprotein n=1 Tax=Borrelia miyamotoi TaxID=47466 RepID=A0AAQ2WXZ9_9SPIR|nr:hypothetical protein [Borrelia miyamotoi]AOW96344.1 hypothetical protein AXH25_04210 [Borrelia miyamotoi]QTL84062.1 hypothetical protein bmLB2001_001136 [Borrelia miyamotoi]WAZ85776.1 hypothetical protein O5400_05350 [Borrelia miyamotoi]WAZ91558.1 hypothetical protein O5398_05340 [Borrelia miyamotoi]WAZ92846.1 hypothetical protein O5402_05350 [Borrelia miyamotoi]